VTAFLRQLRWELRTLWRRPRTYAGFAAALGFEVVLLALLELPSVRDAYLRRIWRLHETLGIRDPFSALGNTVEVTGQTMVFVGGIAIATVAADLIAREADDGLLRMTFCRPVSRSSVLAQKLVAGLSYVWALAAFVATSSLALALAFEPVGQLVLVSPRDGILGVHEVGAGLARWAGSLPLLAGGMCTVACLAFAVSCLRVRAATATMIVVVILLGDWIVHTHPALAPVSPYTLTTRLASWRLVFHQEIPWARLERNYGQLVGVDLGLLAIAWLAFRRRALVR
jgi:ABC-2 type transport system permease protein